MGKYYAVYKCLMCSCIFRVSDSAVEIDENNIPELLARVVKSQQFIGNQYLYNAPMYLPHHCKNGDGGLAHFIGFKKID